MFRYQAGNGAFSDQRIIAGKDNHTTRLTCQGVTAGPHRGRHVTIRSRVDHEPGRVRLNHLGHVMPLLRNDDHDLCCTTRSKRVEAAYDHRAVAQGEQLFARAHAAGFPGREKDGSHPTGHRPLLMEINCPTMLTAISSGVWAPISSPTGVTTRARCGAVNPSVSRVCSRVSRLRRLPSRPIKPASVARQPRTAAKSYRCPG